MAVAVFDAPSFFVTGGTLPPAAPSYIQRQADRDLLRFMREGEFCYVLNARQMGKSSLSVRTMAALKDAGVRTVFIDLTKLGGRNVTADQWYAGLLAEIGRALGLRQEFVKYFVEHKELGAMQRFFGAIREVGLEQIEEPLCIFIDEVDATRALSFSADEFFAGIRECYNRRVIDSEYKRLTFCLLGVAAPSDLIQDVRTTPFNIGKSVTLRDFTLEEALQLEGGLGKNADRVLRRVLYWTHGHPYLTQTLCASVAQQGIDSPGAVDKLVHDTFFEKKARMGHVNLADVANRVLNGFDSAEGIDSYRAEILQLYSRIRSKRSKVADDSSSHLQTVLRLSGLVRVDGGQVLPRNRIYETVFDEQWIEENMPGKELRRQKRAFRLGMIRAASIGGVIVLAMAALALYSMVMAKAAGDARERANYDLYVANVELMNSAWEENNIDRIRELLVATKNHPAKGWEWSYWNRVAHMEVLSIEDAEPGYGPMFSPDGKEIVMRYRTKMDIYDSSNGRLLRSFPMSRPSLGFAVWTPDGKRILDPATDDGLFIYDAVTGALVLSIDAKQHTTSLRPFSPDGRFLVSSPGDFQGNSRLTVWNAQTGKLHQMIELPGRTLHGASFSAQGANMLALYWKQDHTAHGVLLYDVEARKFRHEFSTRFVPHAALLSPDDKLIAIAGANGFVQLMNAVTGADLSTVNVHVGTITQLDWTNDGRYLATVGADRIARIWAVRNGSLEEINTIRGAGLVDFAPDGKRILAGYFDVKVYDPFAEDDFEGHKMPGKAPGRVRINPSGKFAFFAADKLHLLNPSFSEEPWPSSLPNMGIAGDDGKFLLLGSHSSGWQLVRAVDWKVLMRMENPKSPPAELNVSANGDRAAIVFDDRSIGVYDVANGKMIHRFYAAERFTAADLSPDGKTLITGNLWGDVIFWNVDSGAEFARPKGHTRTVTWVAFADDGSRAITTSDDDTAIVWDAQKQSKALTLTGHSQIVLAARFAPDMSRIVTASRDGTARLWDANTGRELLILRGHNGEVLSATFTPDGEKIVTSGADGFVHVWSAQPRR
jgi:WD40 repeat protein